MPLYLSKLNLFLLLLIFSMSSAPVAFSQETGTIPGPKLPGNNSAVDPIILPSLLLTGTIEAGPAATTCKPFSLRYSVANAGDISPSSGTVRIDFIPPSGQSLYTKQFPLGMGERTIVIDAMNVPQDTYLLRLSVSASNEQYKITREYTLAEQSLTVSGPLEVKRVNAPSPRVLVWQGREGRVVEQAVTEIIVKQAFEQEDVYYKVVDSEDAFAASAMTGLFNSYLLLEPQEMPLKIDWLKEKLERGQGIAIIGAGEIARNLAQNFGFSFEEVSSKQSRAVLTFTGNEGLNLSGTLPVSGKTFYPYKKGTKPAAIYSTTGKDAALIDVSRKGKMLVMPISYSYSAFNGGAPALYSLILRTISFFVAPETDETNGPAAGELWISSPGGQANARITEVLPSGSKFLWANTECVFENNTLSCTLTTDKEPKKLLYLYQPPASGKAEPVTEIYYDCGGTFTRQGKIESW